MNDIIGTKRDLLFLQSHDVHLYCIAGMCAYLGLRV